MVFILLLNFSLFAEATEIINPSANPALFSPNNDGRKDSTAISFTSSKYWSLWTVKISNTLNNRVVRTFAGLIEDNSKDISVEWDGKDENGNVLADETYKFKIRLESDAEPPETVIIPDKPVVVHNETNFASLDTGYELQAIDYGTPASGVDTIYYKINEALDWDIYTDVFYLPTDGLYNIDYKSKDRAGNQEKEKHYTVYADGTPPEIPLGLLCYIHGSTVYLKWMSNTEWDFAGYNIYRNGEKITAELIKANSYTDLELPDGEHEYSITSVDIFGNESEKSRPVNIILDGCLEISKPEEGSTNENLTLIWADMICRGEFKYLKIEYGEGGFPEYWNTLKETEIKANRFRVACPWLTKDLDGTYTIRARGTKEDDTLREDSVTVFIYNLEMQEVVNAAGNTVQDNDDSGNTPLVIVTTGKVSADSTPPQIIISGVNNEEYYAHSVCADIQITDEYISEYYIVLEKDNNIEMAKTGNNNTNYRICVEEEAEYEILAEAKDKSDNVANASVSFVIDKTPPVAQVQETDDEDTLVLNEEYSTNTNTGLIAKADEDDKTKNTNKGKGKDGKRLEDIVDEIISSSNNIIYDDEKTRKKSGKGWVSVNAKGKFLLSLSTNGKKKYVINLARLKNKGKIVEITYLDAQGNERVLVLTNSSLNKKWQKGEFKKWLDSLASGNRNAGSIKKNIDKESKEKKSDEGKSDKDKDKKKAEDIGRKKSTDIKDYIEKVKKQKKDKEKKNK